MVGTDVEMIAVMAKYSPFAEHAGMKKICVQEPWGGTVRIAEALKNLGFDLKFLGSQRYVVEKLQALSQEQTRALKDAIAKAPHPRLKKEITELRHVP